MEQPLAISGRASSAAPADHEPNWKRFQEAVASLPPFITLDSEGNIAHLSAAAQRLLEYRSDARVQPCFFSHVHAKNQYQVMRDIADMVCHGKRHATWLLRLRTGRGRWRWFKADVRNHLDDEPSSVTIHLNELRDW